MAEKIHKNTNTTRGRTGWVTLCVDCGRDAAAKKIKDSQQKLEKKHRTCERRQR